MSKPGITIISLNYAPEDTAIGLHSSQMAEYLVEHGWQVQVICGFPYYPKWEIEAEYKNRPTYFKETINGVEVFRYKQYVPKNPTFKSRSVQIVDFTLGNLLNLNKIKKTDIVFSVIPFTSSAWLGNRLARMKNIPHWVHIQDFEFDAAFESGVTSSKKQGLVARNLFKLESSILNSATVVSTISNGMLNKLKTKYSGVRYFFPNWVDENFINPKLAKKHSFLVNEKFQILYSGNIGAKQDWDFFIQLAKKCESDITIEFVVVGDGGMKSELQSRTANMSNILIYDPVPYVELNDLLCSADLHILFQKNEVVDTVMPSKILGMMCSSKPSLVTGNMKSEVATVFAHSEGGVYLDGCSIDDSFLEIQQYKNNVDLAINAGNKARNYVVNQFSRKKVLDDFTSKLTETISQ